MAGWGLLLLLCRLLVTPGALAAETVPSGTVSDTAVSPDVPYGIGRWPDQERGNHRAVVRVTAKAEAVWAHIPWRRRDPAPETKEIVVLDATTGARVTNVVRLAVNRESGDIAFEPTSGPGLYEVYYLPYKGGHSLQDQGTYLPPQETAADAWRARAGLAVADLASGAWRRLPQAELVEIQARSEFDRFDPMEVIATAAETADLVARHPGRDYLLFPEDRRNPVRMADDLPLKCIRTGPAQSFGGSAQPGEYYVFQVAVYAARAAIRNLTVEPSDLVSVGASVVPRAAVTCFNTEGTDWVGRPLAKEFPVGQGKVRPLWLGVQVPRDAQGDYTGTITVRPEGLPAQSLTVSLQVAGAVLDDAGDSELWRLSRLRWLNSTLGLDDDVVPPFTPLEVRRSTVRMLGREVTFGRNGLPVSIRSNGREILADPVSLAVVTPEGPLKWSVGKTEIVKSAPARLVRQTVSRNEAMEMTLRTDTEADGCLSVTATLRCLQDTLVSDVTLNVPYARDIATYMMGMGRRGGYRPQTWDWAWDVAHADNMVWIGEVDAGMQTKLCNTRDVWELYNLRTSGVPASWGNGGQGGCRMQETQDSFRLTATSGERRLAAGAELAFRFRFLITPLKPPDPQRWDRRYAGFPDGNIYHMHHSHPWCPYINYPFATANAIRENMGPILNQRTKPVDVGRIEYPARGNLDLRRGALHLWARVDFDPWDPALARGKTPLGLWQLVLPNSDAVSLVWDAGNKAMLLSADSRDPDPAKRHVRLAGGVGQILKKGQRHLLTLSWGEQLALFADGRKVGQMPLSGLPDAELGDARLRWYGSGFSLEAVKIADTDFLEGQAATPTADEHTLFLQTFAEWSAGSALVPQKGLGKGTAYGVVNPVQAEGFAGIRFGWNERPCDRLGFNLYYTVREYSVRAAELWPLRSLGDEAFLGGGALVYTDKGAIYSGSGGGHPWLQEHLAGGYSPAWLQPLGQEVDISIGTQGLSRLHNHYVEGLRWLMDNAGVDGVYLDGIGYDREIMKRVAKVLYRGAPNGRIDFHGGNSFDFMDTGVSPANGCLEHFAYLRSLYVGEFFDYNRSPDYWLVEISGIPFGVTGDLLGWGDCLNPYRGMVYGMTYRHSASAAPLWRLWDEFGIQAAEMLGYWSSSCPVTTDNPNVKATVYRRKNSALIALACWPAEPPRDQDPEVVVGRAAKPPNVDGRIAPGEWDAGAQLAGFVAQTGETARDQTAVYLQRDEQNLYLAYRCDHWWPALRAESNGSTPPLADDDSVEFVIGPASGNPQGVRFTGNSKGVKTIVVDGIDTAADWNYRATVVSPTAWEGELAIPLAALGPAAASEGYSIGFNACRNHREPIRRRSAWVPGEGAAGRLVLSDLRPVTRKCLPPAAPVPVHLTVDWKALGLRRDRAVLRAPAVDYFQPEREFRPGEAIPVAPDGGWLLSLEAAGDTGG
jgi:hypothetical protein